MSLMAPPTTAALPSCTYLYKNNVIRTPCFRIAPDILANWRLICLYYLSAPNESLHHEKQFKSVYERGGGRILQLVRFSQGVSKI